MKVRHEQTPENSYDRSGRLHHALRHNIRRPSRRTWPRPQTCTTASCRQASHPAKTTDREASQTPQAAEDRPPLPTPAFPPRLPLVRTAAATVHRAEAYHQPLILKTRGTSLPGLSSLGHRCTKPPKSQQTLSLFALKIEEEAP